MCPEKLFCIFLAVPNGKAYMYVCPFYVYIFLKKNVFCILIGCIYRWLHPIKTVTVSPQKLANTTKEGGEADRNQWLTKMYLLKWKNDDLYSKNY